MTQSCPDLAVPLAMERTGGKHAPDRRRQCLIRHRAERPAPLRRRRHRGGEMAIHARAGEPPHTADCGQAVRFAGNRRDEAAHGLRLPRAKGRPASRRAIFSFSRSRSISAAPSLAFSRSLSSSSPVVARVVRAASPPARKASCQPVSVAAVTPSSRETVSRSSPRNSRSTAALLRWRDILPPRPGATAPDPCARAASPGPAPTWFIWSSMAHLSCGNRPLARCPNQPCCGGILNEGQGKIGGAMLPPPEGLWGMPADMLQTIPGYGGDVATNRAEARKIMEKLGYGPNKRLEVRVSARNVASYRDPAVILIDQLKEIYIDGVLDTVETANWHTKVTRKDYAVALNATGSGVDDPDQQSYENYACGSPRNYSGFCNKELDSKFDEQSAMSDQEARKKLVWEIDRTLQEDQARPIIFHNTGA